MTSRPRHARRTPESRPWLSSMIKDFSSTARWAHERVGARDAPQEEVMREQPDAKSAVLYAPLPMPSFAEMPLKTPFEERGDLDAAIADICLEWAAKLAAQGTPTAASQTVYYLGRASQFRTLAPEQQRRRLEL